jgi:dipeptidyl aminopeptidase/acylaminoacyl peptidase
MSRADQRRAFAAGFVLILALAAAAAPSSQTKPAVTPAEYGQWETLVTHARASATGPLSPDGEWIAYGVNRSNRNNELRIAPVATGKTITVAFGDSPAFSADSRWVACLIGVSEAEEEKQQRERKPVRRKLGLVDLTKGETVTIDGIESFAFSADGTHLALRTYPPEPPRPERPAGDAPVEPERDPVGTTVIIRKLADGSSLTFGNVTEYAWQSKGPLLAIAVGVEGRVGNGVHVYHPATGALRVLDSAGSVYSGLTWRRDADDLAVLRSKTDPGREGSSHSILAWTGLEGTAGAVRQLDPATAGLGVDRRIVAARRPEWSRDGRRLFVGVAAWEAKIEGDRPTRANSDDDAAVDVWHWRDVDVMPLQKRRAAADRQRSLLAAWTVGESTLIPLAQSPFDDVRLADSGDRALVVERLPYAMERSIGRPAADVSLVDLATGTRTAVKARVEDQYVQASPDGRFVLYLSDDQYWVFNVETGAHINLTRPLPTSFIDRQSDVTVKQKPPYGVGGWTTGSASVLLYDRYDVWEVPTNGSQATKLTDGAAEQIRHRYVRLDPNERFIDRGATIFFATFGEWTKKSGYARLTADEKVAQRLVWLDKRVDRLTRAQNANVLAYAVQAFDDSPDYFVSSSELASARQVSATNPFQENYAWGRSELIEYKSARGERLQGALYYPAGYTPGRQYPMVVYMYERLSDGLHAYSSPSDRAPYNAGAFTSRGYFFFQPDIVFRPRDPGLSVVDCVLPAVKAVLAKGAVDPGRVGITGHSWGGFDTTFLATHTTTFAAAVAGAPITNLVSNYGNHHWSQGIAETDHIETGQQRMEVPIYDDLQAYIRNSAVFGVHAMKTPLLVAFGENDGTVHWHQGVELYNIARRAGRPVVLLAYANEDHSLRRRANQQDYHRRIFEWFGHYLKGEPAAEWIVNGVSALERERQLQRRKPAATTTTSGS